MRPFSMTFRLRPGLLLAVILLVGLAGLWQLANNAADKVDEEVAALTRKTLQQELLRQRKTLGQSLNDYAVWDEMYRQSQAPQMDKAWLAANLTGSVYQNLDVDIALLLDPAAGVLYALDRGVVSPQPQHCCSWNAAVAEPACAGPTATTRSSSAGPACCCASSTATA
jgi:hypothetical protein